MKQLLILLLIPLVMHGQPNLSAAHIEDISVTFDDFAGEDQFGSMYFIANNVFIKQNGKERLEYNNIGKGKITRADVTNPLMIVLLYADFNSIVLLDNQLNEIREIEFSRNQQQVVVAAGGLAEQNRLWIYDAITQQLMLYDLSRNTLRPLATPLRSEIAYYETNLTSFKWIDQTGHVYICDVYGEVRSIGNVAGFDHVSFASNNTLLMTDDGILYHLDLSKNESLPIADVGKSVSKFYFKDQILSIFTKAGITKYKIILP